MSGGLSAGAIGGIVSAAVGAVAAYDSHQQGKRANSQAKKQAAQAERDALNARVKRRNPDTQSALDQAALDARGGASGTLLTGPGGVDTGSLSLGRTTLLGS